MYFEKVKTTKVHITSHHATPHHTTSPNQATTSSQLMIVLAASS
jgi:hypothetical protein